MTNSADEMDDSLLRRLSDRAAIIDLVHEFQQGVDRKDRERQLATLAPDIVMDLDGNILEGFEATRRYIVGEAGPQAVGLDAMEASVHLVSNVVPKIDGDHARTDEIVISHLVGKRDAQPVIWIRGIRYVDEFVRVEDGWRMCYRNKRLEWMFESVPTIVVPTFVTTGTAVQGSKPSTLTREPGALRRLADVAEIEDLLAEMALGNDRYDLEGMMGCLTEDVKLRFTDTLTGELTVLPGKQAVREVYRDLRLAKTLPLDEVVVATHALANIRVRVEGDTAHATTAAVAYVIGPRFDRSVLLARGISYDDRFRREPEGWRISQRTHSLRWTFETEPTYVMPDLLAVHPSALPINARRG